ncbi:glucan endo-1,3-beta-glucosidase 12-like [Populus nigra]|uniref:glucan endo-1,3-beta-glucosidase 12-like n=1 Tax=Populus nigra TaxID=3691 RepID=UPI002B2673E5|nr:glucan endo-1,3-beta-glucosidase 12-like [Populus nigra]XP_061971741.1 glucan endo-1,3-beta-glucosidase 12-like [Populus nigra]
MGGRVIYSLMFCLLGLFLSSSGSSVTKRSANENSERAGHGSKQAVVLVNSIYGSQKDITTPITTVPTIIPTTSTPLINPNSDPDSTSPATITPMVTPTSTTTPVSPGASWCIASPSASPTALQVALDYACGYGGADCSAILPSGSCYNPNTVHDHASYAFNSYYQKNPVPSSCNFGGTAATTSTNPSTGTCQFPSTSTSSSVLNTTNSNGATVYGAVPSNPSPSVAAKINEKPHFVSLTFIILLLAKLTSTLGYRG